MQKINVSEVEYLAFSLGQQILSFNEPIPDSSTRFPNILESCLVTPFQGFSGVNPYQGLIGKAAIFFYLMAKNRPFQNGNKRIAMTALMVLLHRNKKWIKADTQELYNFMIWITQSPPKFKEETVKAIEKFLKTHIIDL